MSRTTRPVTHTAEVDVKSASQKEAPCPSRVETGSMSSRLPSRMAAAKPRMMICEDVKCRLGRFIRNSFVLWIHVHYRMRAMNTA